MTGIMSSRTTVIIGVVGLIAVIGLTFVLEPFRNYQLATIAAYLCAVAGLTMLTGVNGQLSLGHAALMACGAYCYAFTANGLAEQEIEGPVLLIVPIIAAVVGATVLGLVIGLAAARLHGPYLAGVTLAFVIALPAVTSRFSDVFGGDQGLWITVERRPEFLAGRGGTEMFQAWVAIACAAVVVVLLRNLMRSNFGRQMRAVRDNEVAAALAGINVARTKVIAFTVSSAAAGIGGAVMAFMTQSASPGAFNLFISLFLLMAAVIGGIGTLYGALWGSILLVVLPDVIGSITRGLSLSPEVAQRLDGNLAVGLFGAVMVLVVIVAPFGIQGLVRKAGHQIRSRGSLQSAPHPK
ncbi:branched-chain amino acid ABC transporter permease [Salinibacterium sp. SYSU T00001]|uniref:branched-chain amino acid ABC transporter permease n=1 Tax=Homoserinimonas sedimenticola TaxID=2986805 RepID=UPI0022365A38|nr:branched-chain amino acid ABC transporter permease [Salinibacterium sedimenticola]MCW4386083.1 branched-chain amino acid ABC transporter permease [Salinibacterium sedimenticola]